MSMQRHDVVGWTLFIRFVGQNYAGLNQNHNRYNILSYFLCQNTFYGLLLHGDIEKKPYWRTWNKCLWRRNWAVACENVSLDICGQQRPRSDCASAQSDQGLYCPLTESLDTICCIHTEKRSACYFVHAPDYLNLRISGMFEVGIFAWSGSYSLIWASRRQHHNTSCVTSTDSDQPVYPLCMARVLVYLSLDSPEAVEGTCDQWRLWSDCADAQSDLSPRWSHGSYCRFCPSLAQNLQ